MAFRVWTCHINVSPPALDRPAALGHLPKPAAVRLAAKHNIEVPLIQAAAEILCGGRKAIDVLENLMTRPVEVDCAPGQDEGTVDGCKWSRPIHKNFGSEQW